MGEKGNGPTAEKVLSKGVAKSWVAVIRRRHNGIRWGIRLRVLR